MESKDKKPETARCYDDVRLRADDGVNILKILNQSHLNFEAKIAKTPKKKPKTVGTFTADLSIFNKGR